MATSAGNAGESNGTAAKRDEFRDVLAACVSEQKLCEPRRLQTEEASTCAKEAVLRTERIAKCARLEVKGLAKLQNIVDEQLRAVNVTPLLSCSALTARSGTDTGRAMPGGELPRGRRVTAETRAAPSRYDPAGSIPRKAIGKVGQETQDSKQHMRSWFCLSKKPELLWPDARTSTAWTTLRVSHCILFEISLKTACCNVTEYSLGSGEEGCFVLLDPGLERARGLACQWPQQHPGRAVTLVTFKLHAEQVERRTS
eukprot:180679-Rhodomonas_salina.1